MTEQEREDGRGDTRSSLMEKVSRLPTGPGVYQHKDRHGSVLYVGKAKNLRSRVRSYFPEKPPREGRMRLIYERTADVEVIVTDTEAEALILENNLIKHLRPRYNIELRDDKSYPSICLKNERFPRIFPTRRLVQDGSTYFGPYANVGDMKLMLRAIRSIFKLRTCSLNLSEHNIKAGKYQPCLEYHIKKCAAPCVGWESEESYNETIRQVQQLLNGRTKALVALLTDEMKHCAAEMRFEEASEIRDKIRGIERFSARQKVVTDETTERDLFALVVDRESDIACGVMFQVREGKIIGRQQKVVRGIEGSTDAQLMQKFVEGYYVSTTFYPGEVFLSMDVEDVDPLHQLLADRLGRKVSIKTPERGAKAELMRMVEANADLALAEYRLLVEKQKEGYVPHSLVALKRDLHLSNLPKHIECFDISHLSGTGTVASCVIFANGKPLKSEYRTFKIRSVADKPDDFQSMREVVSRRYARVVERSGRPPDLIVVDGGKGQLSAAVEALKAVGVYGSSAVIGLAKRLEEVFVPGDSDPVLIPKASASLRLLQRIRNEAHRFAVEFQRKQRKKSTVRSELTEIPGIGQKTAQKLLKHFGSVRKIRNATLEKLEEIAGRRTAQRIVEHWTADAQSE